MEYTATGFRKGRLCSENTAIQQALPGRIAGRSFTQQVVMCPPFLFPKSPVNTIQDRNQTILDSLSEGILAVSSAGRVLAANRYMSDLTGLTGNLEGRESATLFSGSDEIRAIVNVACKSGVHANDRDVTFESPEGLRHVRVNTTALDFDGDAGIVVVLRDVSDLKRLEREMFQAEKMNALGRLAASVAHEVRNPLGAVTIQLQLLVEDVEEVAPELRGSLLRRLSVANAEIKRLDGIVGNFLRFSRGPQLELADLSVNDVVRRVFELVTPEAREYGVRLELDLAKDLPAIEGDENQLGQAILNLTVNAFHAVDGGGTVRASTVFGRDTNTIRLTLVDDGRGIDSVDMNRVFELYYTTKAEGTGLGLSIAQRVIYEHGGSIEAESEPGHGTVFTITLPVAMSARTGTKQADAEEVGDRDG
jgi:PAS domain S-box-containing protein